MIQLEEKAAEALACVQKAEKLMAELGHTKYSLSGMCSAAMRRDLEKEVCELLGELAEARKDAANQRRLADLALAHRDVIIAERDTLVEALHSIRHRLGDFQEPWNSRESYIDTIAHQAIAAVEGGSHE